MPRIRANRPPIFPSCSMRWPRAVQYMLDHPGEAVRSRGYFDFAGRLFQIRLKIENGLLQYQPLHDGESWDTKWGSAAAHDFKTSELFMSEARCTAKLCKRCNADQCDHEDLEFRVAVLERELAEARASAMTEPTQADRKDD